ncbi:MAG: VCBS repeat-containing protein [Phycisphaerales bacterium]|nr:VCBS repeat-containing protein [Phycisphaerales bacterium]
MDAHRVRCVVFAAGVSCIVPWVSANEEPFVDQAVARGVNYTLGTNFTQWGTGIAFADLDNDGDPDLILTGATNGKIALYQNNGSGHFTDRTVGSGIAASTNMGAVCLADYDADGDQDIFFTRWQGFTNLLYRNEGNFIFTNVTVAAGLSFDGAASGANWGDYDGDGWLDLYVSYRTGTNAETIQNKLFRNNGDGTFTDVAAALGVQAPDDPTLLATFIDYDNDSDSDLYLGTDKGSGSELINRLFRNDGGTFTEVTEQANAAAHIDCMGIAIADIDYNGYQDMFLTNVQFGHKLLMGDASGVFSEQAAAAGVECFQVGWGCVFFDYNNDRTEDLFIAHVDNTPNRLFRNPGSFPFEDVSVAMGVALSGFSYVCAIADVDMDGDLDLGVATSLQRFRLYINNEGDNRHWLKLKLVGIGANVDAIGAQARVTHLGLTQMRELFAGANYRSDNERLLHFGIGNLGAPTERIEVRWPNSNVYRVLTGYPVDRVWTIYPPHRLGDANANGMIDPAEIAEALHIMVATAGGHIQPGQEIYDIDGDCDVDRNDLASMLATYTRVNIPVSHAPTPTMP